LHPVLVWQLVAVGVAALASCSTPKQEVDSIRLGMTKAELVKLLGQPAEVGDSRTGRNGKLEEVWLYDLSRDVETGRDVTVGVLTSGVGFFDDPTAGRRHEFVFTDDQLVRWGPVKK